MCDGVTLRSLGVAPIFFMSPTEQVLALLGEHFKNYVVITQDYESPCSFQIYESDPYVALGLLSEAQKFSQQKVDEACEVTYEWSGWDLSDNDEEEEDPDI